MTNKEFEKIAKEQIEFSLNLLCSKGEEYSESGSLDNSDRLSHFKRAAVIMNSTPKAALWSMLTKHLISLSDMCTNGTKYDKDRWTEKITDSMNYLLLLKALIIEEGE